MTIKNVIKETPIPKKTPNITKELILTNAFSLFLQFGFAEVSVNDIVLKSGIAKGGFYHYFKSKDDLIIEIIDRFICPYFQYPIENMKKDFEGETQCWNAYEKLKGYYTKNPMVYVPHFPKKDADKIDPRDFQFLVFEGMKKYDYLAQLRCKFYRERQEILKEILEQGKKEGLIRPSICSCEWAQTIDALKNGIISLNLLDKTIDIEEKFLVSFEQIWNEIQAKPNH